ncbi:MAG: hypothetical protein QG584_1940 [Pseudomonadota bacterium]|nr:hypothetical protein [Pseudomonadota bacterium]
MGLVHGNVGAQAVLEDILEGIKPVLPPEVKGLHWLLATPFRYWPLPGGSRFRRREDPGVFYGAEERETACAEAGYWRLKFWNESTFLSQQPKSIPVTLFEFHAATPRTLDLSRPPLVEDRTLWMLPDDYTSTQALADNARQASAEVLRYESVRRLNGRCLAILSPVAFRSVAEPLSNNQQSWSLLINPPHQLVWQRELSQECWTFDF